MLCCPVHRVSQHRPHVIHNFLLSPGAREQQTAIESNKGIKVHDSNTTAGYSGTQRNVNTRNNWKEVENKVKLLLAVGSKEQRRVVAGNTRASMLTSTGVESGESDANCTRARRRDLPVWLV